MKLRRPPAIAHGETFLALSPASTPQKDRVEHGAAALRRLGYKVEFAAHALDRSPLYFAGEPAERAADLSAAFAAKSNAALICNRGGYGSNYLLPLLNPDLLAENPKVLFGYSDITALQTWLLDRAGLPSFHGPMLAADFARKDGVHSASFKAAIAGDLYAVGEPEGLQTLRRGTARGVLYGGCLSILAASLGTPYAPDLRGKLLFLEDLATRPYQVDRLLRQLILAGQLEGVTGIIFGEMLDCASPGAPDSLLKNVILHVLGDFSGPVAIGLRSGHVSRENVTLTFGTKAVLNASNSAQLEFVEAATQK
jgi:muramoyltetrapeptide carboxypeptidase